ncbi:MAG: TatD family hydrolase [Planctomycetota bacterium]
MIDSHAHLNDKRFDADRGDVVGRAQAAGIGLMICPGTNLAGSREALDLAHRYDCVLAAAGMDRDSAALVNADSLDGLERLAADDRCVAIGEIGIDYHYETLPRGVQRAGFEAQIELANRLDLPVIVHCRDAFDDCLEILERTRPRGVMHCFSGDAATALRCCDLGMMISFAGTVTFKKADALREAARAVPAEHLLIETDCPYLAPAPRRGRRNEPAYLEHTAKFLAGVLDLSTEDVERITDINARILFGLPVDTKTAIVYPIRNSLYVNLTNRCTNRCVFCPRSTNPRVKGHWLGMSEGDEPGAEDVIAAVGDPAKYDEIVFCGFGEPTLRLAVMLEVAKWVKARGGRTRVNTNGQCDLIAGKPTAPLMKGLIDTVSVSLNTADAAQYAELCRPEYGERAHPAVIAFIKSAKANTAEVAVTALDYPGVDTDAVEKLAAALGAVFRRRAYKHLG